MMQSLNLLGLGVFVGFGCICWVCRGCRVCRVCFCGLFVGCCVGLLFLGRVDALSGLGYLWVHLGILSYTFCIIG
jgi:hypothetical protein